ncbi:unnamed protein product [Brassica oleracea var. botrytis]|uniref:Uncharacterized protein n=3 Tax=Brassica TaxID=3705 RepID=A0A0D3AUL1_BRAOL|nr:unnamed protein product [Brassica napus]VDD25367.1 unnamed protein product [Brassica oleracea]
MKPEPLDLSLSVQPPVRRRRSARCEEAKLLASMPSTLASIREHQSTASCLSDGSMWFARSNDEVPRSMATRNERRRRVTATLVQ